MNILLIASEAVPFCKKGILADAVAGLAKELATFDDVRIAIPKFRTLINADLVEPVCDIDDIPLGIYNRPAQVFKIARDVTTYLIQQEFYFGRSEMYGFLDDYERFIFFTRSIFKMLTDDAFQKQEKAWFPEIIQGFDWPTCFFPAWLNEDDKSRQKYENTRFVLSIFNLRQMGIFGGRALKVAGLKDQGIYPECQETPSRINFLARGILGADAVITPSRNFLKEHPDSEVSKTLTWAFSQRKPQEIIPVRTAINYHEYDPANDNALTYPYAKYPDFNPKVRMSNKLAFQHDQKMAEDDDIPLIGMVGHLTSVKGLDLLHDFKEQFLDRHEAQFILMGDPSDPSYLEMFESLEGSTCKGKKAFKLLGYDETIARRIFAACDLILIPSREEPCGTQQLIAMRYGAVPLVHLTGMLATTVQPYEPGMNLNSDVFDSPGIGFTFSSFVPDAFYDSLEKALIVYSQRNLRGQDQVWYQIQRNNMNKRFSWIQPARKYMETYRSIKNLPRRQLPETQGRSQEFHDQLLQAILEIDSLPGLALRDANELMKQAARLVRELFDNLACDAVYVWTVGDILGKERGVGNGWHTPYPRQERLFLVSDSLDRSHTRPVDPDLTEVTHLLDQATARSWSESIGSNMSANSSPLTNLMKWPLAIREGWVDGRTIPITAHSRLMGRIDLLFRAHLVSEKEEVVNYALTMLANSFGFRLETIRLALESDRVLDYDRRLLSARSLSEVVDEIISIACEISHSDAAWLYLPQDNKLEFVDVGRSPTSEIVQTARSIAQSAFDLGEVLLVSDWAAIQNEINLPINFHPLMAIPLKETPVNKNDKPKPYGALVVARHNPPVFSHDDERLISNRLGPQAKAALNTARWQALQSKERVAQLQRLATSLTGGDYRQLLNDVVRRTAEVLEAEAASLYLVDENGTRLEIQSAYGYHEPLLKEKANYSLGEGVTGTIWEKAQTIKADSLNQLHLLPGWLGKHKTLQNGREPEAFLGIPLRTTIDGKEKVIGVLKLENRIHTSPNHLAVFTEEDMHLGEMMANVIATVVYNKQLSEKRLNDLSRNLGQLSQALAGSQDMQTLMNNIVNTIAEVVVVDASSLYLADDKRERLNIQAAYGYQEPLVEAHAYYMWNEGVTGRIAQTNQPFLANSLEMLRKEGGSQKGRYDDLQGGKRPNSFYGVPLNVSGQDKPLGVLKLEREVEKPFTEENILLIQMMANVIATVVYNAQMSEKRLNDLSANLSRLSQALAGSQDMQTLMNTIVNTIAEVVVVDASSLYLADDKRERLNIQAAYGYQNPLVEAQAYYMWGEGVTGRIAQTNQPFLANSLKMLRKEGGSQKGRYDDLQGGKRPTSFYGVPLNVSGQGKPLGVLKLEREVEKPFTEENILLIQMMANVIATVVYNAQMSQKRLNDLSTNLGQLSKALSGSQDMQTLMNNIVTTIGEVVRVDAATLYLADDNSQRLNIQAAYGYQKPLIEAQAYYLWGEGVTGRIAQNNRPFLANSLDLLRKEGGSQKGRYDDLQGGKRPMSFFGIPLNVAGRDKPIGVLKVESQVYRPFTSEDILLITMMANVIATVVYSAQIDQKQMENLIFSLGSVAYPQEEASRNLLTQFATSSDTRWLQLLAAAEVKGIGDSSERALQESLALIKMKANPLLYSYIGEGSLTDVIHRFFRHVFDALRNTSEMPFEETERLIRGILAWSCLEAESYDSNRFSQAVCDFTGLLAGYLNAEVVHPDHTEIWQSGPWQGMLLDTHITFEHTYLDKSMPIVFHKESNPTAKDLDILGWMLAEMPHAPLHAILPLWCEREIFNRLREMLRSNLITHSIILLDLETFQSLVSAQRPDVALQKIVLSQINLKRISPYKYGGPADQHIFYGREQEVAEISNGLRNGSYLVIGGRRIGKSSIINYLHEVRLPKAGFLSLLIDGIRFSSARSLRQHRLVPEYWRPTPPTNPPATFEDLLEEPPTGKPFVLLMDEVDKLIPISQQKTWNLFKKLHALDSSRRGRFVLAGENALGTMRSKQTSPLYNIGYELLLGPLDYRAVSSLVTNPMGLLDIQLENEERIVNKIYDVSCGHPYMVQFLCANLIERINDQSRRNISLDDVDEVVQSPNFKNKLLETYWERATDIEKIISILMARIKSPCNLTEVIQLLKDEKLFLSSSEVSEALKRLVDLRSILRMTKDGTYEFAVPAFPEILGSGSLGKDHLLLAKESYSKGVN